MKNKKIATKLLFMIVPLVVMVVLLLFVTDYMVRDTQAQIKEVFKEQLYETNNLLTNADRDIYQAYKSLVKRPKLLVLPAI